MLILTHFLYSDWSASFSLSADGNDKPQSSTASKLFSSSFQPLDVESYKLECRV
jgi:hypothetical protein